MQAAIEILFDIKDAGKISSVNAGNIRTTQGSQRESNFEFAAPFPSPVRWMKKRGNLKKCILFDYPAAFTLEHI